ncbi:family 20 glycosylhydrolase [Coraliomargarita sp. SDUM461003]|uniref:Family 20 glycosylhydrolase n=1 Tax=Thalassobacterium maritimum TaxID=3041265 RepID=A0ABU1AW59_9BACT|nr:family 20 glycosylhydrolase [Coraliomargarita sp. SDUM461003]MDQ8208326.1 family 20 glycosylhydrolase [Coraliomargarita sp. SDUM461003]
MNTPLHTVYSTQTPAVDRRGVHLDLKGLPPTFERLMDLVEVFAQMRFNMLVVEWEDMFPWSFDPSLRNPSHYTREQVKLFVARCGELGIELIPLVQCLGHLEFVLQHEAHQHLAESPDFADTLNPLHPGSADLIIRMLDEVLSLMPGVKHFHLGGDEAWSFGTHPDSKKYIAEHGKNSLYLQHVQPILDALRGREVRPLLWHDMMMDWPIESLQQIGAQADLVVWGYRGTPAMGTHHHRTPVLDHLRAAGIPIWGASAYKGADGPFRDLPNQQARLLNHVGWMDVAEPYSFKGLIATGWSRYASGRVQVEAIDACLPELAMASLIFYNGSWSENGWETCDQLLQDVGELERSQRLRQHFESADAMREEAWLAARQLKEQLAGMQVAPGLPSAGTNRILWDFFLDLVQRTEAHSEQLPELLKGLVCAPFIDSYYRTWATALRTEADTIKARLKTEEL